MSAIANNTWVITGRELKDRASPVAVVEFTFPNGNDSVATRGAKGKKI